MSGRQSDVEVVDINENVSECSLSEKEAGNDDDIFETKVVADTNDPKDELFLNSDDKNKQKADDKFEIPSDELVDKIVKQVEYYFSDGNIVKDEHLRKLIKQSKTQFVHLKVITAFNKMKKLTKCYKTVAYAINKASTELVLDKSKCKVKRVKPLPDQPQEDFGDTSKVVLATSLANQSSEVLQELFSQCGKVLKIEIIDSNSKLPRALKKMTYFQRKSSIRPAALVEYDQAECATRATITLTDKSDWRKGMRVELLSKFCSLAPPRDKENKNDVQGKQKEQERPQKKQKNKNKCQTGQVTETDLTSTVKDDLKKPPSPILIEKHGIPIPKKISCSPSHTLSPENSPKSLKTVMHGKVPPAADDDCDLTGLLSSCPGTTPWSQRRMQEPRGVDNQKSSQVPTLRNPTFPGNTQGFTIKRTLF